MGADQPPSLESIGNFELLERISRGGMGEVYLGRKRGAQGFSRVVAIKVIHADVARLFDARTAFFDEAQLSARLSHPAVAQVFDFGESNGDLFLSMEYVAGVSFSQLIRRQPGLLPPAQIARLMAEVCRGLHSAHEAHDDQGRPLRVVHRDVSPQNLLLSFSGSVKIIDFGIAKMRDRRSPDTQHGSLKGKPAYIAPEQITADGADRRSDVWAASVVLYELLTGQGLFRADTDWGTFNAVISQPIEPPSRVLGAPLPPGLDEAVLKGLAREPGQRFQSALEMATALDDVVARERPEALEDFVQRALEEERGRHATWLNGVLAAGSTPAVPGAPGVAAGLATPTASRLTLDLGARPRRGRFVAPLLVALLLGGAVGTAVWINGQVPPPAAAAVAAAPPPAPPPVEIAKPVDPPAAVNPIPEPQVEPALEVHRKVAHAKAARVEAKPAVEVPAAPASVGRGTLFIAAEPWAQIRVDGTDWGPTPKRREISAGPHVVELIAADTGDLREHRSVDVRVGETVDVIVR